VATVTVDEVQAELHRQFPKYYPARQRLTKDKTVLKPGGLLKDFDLVEGDTINFKDLGPQVSWTTVFVVEYLGPLLIHPLFYYGSQWIYGERVQHSDIQWLSLMMIMAHFVKRELETLFVHRFSLATMPVRNIFKNSIHYHVFAGLLIAYFVYSPAYAAGTPAATGRSDIFIAACLAVWAFAQVSNLVTHVILRNLRPPGSRVRVIPYGYGFDLVSCPNYFFECVAWAAYSVLVNHWTAWLFTGMGAVQMFQWAVKKHKNYRKDFQDYPKSRKIIVPFIL